MDENTGQKPMTPQEEIEYLRMHLRRQEKWLMGERDRYKAERDEAIEELEEERRKRNRRRAAEEEVVRLREGLSNLRGDIRRGRVVGLDTYITDLLNPEPDKGEENMGIPTQVTVTAESGKKILDMIDNPPEPTEALKALFADKGDCPLCHGDAIGKWGCPTCKGTGKAVKK